MKKIALGLCLLTTVSACVETAEITQEPVVAGVLNTVDRERLAEGTSKMTVRTYVTVADGDKTTRKEITGVKCNLVSDELRAAVIAPQEVILPKFKQRAAYPNRGVPGALSVTCNTGDKQGSALITASEKSVSTATGAGVAGAILTIAVTAAVANSTPWSYAPQAAVTVE